MFGQGLEFFENLAHYQVDFMTGEDCCRMRYQVDFMVGDWLRVGGGELGFEENEEDLDSAFVAFVGDELD